MLRVSADVEASLHVLQPLHESMLVAMGSEFRVLRGQWIELVHVDESVVRQDRFHPNSADVVQARRNQHVRDRAFWHVLARLTPRDVSHGARMRNVDEPIAELGAVAKKTAH